MMNANELLTGSAAAIAAAVRERAVSASAMVEASLARIRSTDSGINAFTDLTAERARRHAADLDAQLAENDRTAAGLPLLGVRFAVKNLFDVAGLTTRAGSKIERDRPPARRDSPLIARLEEAGAVLVGALNMDEYAYGFTTENSHDGATRNPHDPTRIAGGSSGGSAAAAAAGHVPLALGSDTNGSIRVPASLCGTFGLKPTCNLPDVLNEVSAVFARYEDALVRNRADVLDELIWPTGAVVRYGMDENLVGINAIRAFRATRPSAGLARTLGNTVIPTFGRDFATAMTEFHREGNPRVGRQSQTWVRFAEGWRVVAAHVSLLAP